MENERVTEVLDNLKQLFVCKVCTNLLITPTQIQCGHIFCAPCITTIQTTKPSKCPTCNVKVSRRALFVRNDVDNLMQSVVFNLIPVVTAEIEKENNNNMAPILGGTWSTSIDLNDSSSSGSSNTEFDSDRGPPPLKKIFRNRSKDIVKKRAQAQEKKVEMLQKKATTKEAQQEKEIVKKSKVPEEQASKIFQKQDNAKVSQESENAKPPQQHDIAKVSLEQDDAKISQEHDEIPKASLEQDNAKISLEPDENPKVSQEHDKAKVPQEDDNAKPAKVSPEQDKVKKVQQQEFVKNAQENDRTKNLQEQNTPSTSNILEKVQDNLENDSAKKVEEKRVEAVRRFQLVQQTTRNVEKASMNVSLNSSTNSGSFRIKCRNPELMLLPHRPASPDQPMDLSINNNSDKKLKRSLEKHYRSALVYVRPLDLSSKKPLTEALATSAALSIITNAETVAAISINELTTSKTVAISNHEPTSFKRSKTESVISNHRPVTCSRLLFPELKLSYPEALNTNCEPEGSNPQAVISNMDSEQQFIQLVNEMEVDVSPIKPVTPITKSNRDGIYFNLTSTPVSTRSIENGRMDDSVTDLFKDYLSQENRIVANIAKEKDVEIPDNDSVFSQDEIPASPINVVNSPQISTPRKFVFCPTRLTKLQLSKLHQLCQMCSGTIVNEYRDEVTHLIINLENDRVPQTMKYLFAIADKKWIVTYDWVEECITKSKVAAEEPYETSSFPYCDSGVRKSRVCSNFLYEGINFYIAGTLSSSGASIDDCKKLLTKLGGNTIDSPYAVDRDVMIIGDPLNLTNCYQEWYRTKGYITVSWEWILDCLLSFNVLAFSKSHLITKLDSAGLSQACLPEALLSLYKLNSDVP